MMALLPMLAGMGSSGQSQQDQSLNQVMPSKNGEQTQDMAQGGGAGTGQAPGNNGGGQVLSMLAKLGQPQSNQGGAPIPGQPATQAPSPLQSPGQQYQTAGQQPVSSLSTQAAGGPPNGSDFGAYLMQLMKGMN